MSYYKRVIKDNPVGFWGLNNGLISKDTGNGYFNGSTRTFNDATTASGTYVGVQPLVNGGISSMKITSSSTIEIPNIYNILYSGAEENNFSLEFWLNFDTPPSNMKVLSITDGTNEVMSLTFAGNSSILRVYTNKQYYETKAEIETYESQIYVLINYRDKNLNHFAGSSLSQTIKIPDNENFVPVISTPPKIKFGPTSTSYFNIDNIALYNYSLTYEQISSHIFWAMEVNQLKPHSLRNNGGYFQPTDANGVKNGYKIFNTKQTFEQGVLDNLISTQDGNLTFSRINHLKIKSSDLSKKSFSYSTVSTEVGLVSSGDMSLASYEFSNMFNLNTDAITTRVYINTSRASQVSFLSINGFNFGSLILAKTSDHKIRLYSPEGGFDAILSTAYGSSQWVDIKIYFNGTTINTQINTSTIISYDTTSTIYMSDNAVLYLGNSYDNTSGSVLNYPALDPIRLFKIYKISNIPSSLTSPTTNYKVGIDLSTTINNVYLPVSQYGKWSIITNFSDDLILQGTKIYYGGASDKIKVSVSSDNVTFIDLVKNGEQIPSDIIGVAGSLLYINVYLETIDSYDVLTNISFLELIRYSDLTIYSTGVPFTAKPDLSNGDHTYQFRNNNFNILSRDPSLDIHFEPVRNTYQIPGRMDILLNSDIKTVEFWLRMDTDPPSTSNAYILDIAKVGGGSPSIDLIYDVSAKNLTWGTAWDYVYINGKIATSPYAIALNEIYHFTGVVSGVKKIYSGDTLILNGKNVSSTGFHAHGTYSGINMYTDSKDSVFVNKRYLMNLGLNFVNIKDSATLTVSDYEPLAFGAGTTVIASL
jgi:hypothetical protein